MTDKELLELAAKAAGIQLMLNGHNEPIIKGLSSNKQWNPLCDDADAFQLMVKLSYMHRMPLNLYFGVDTDCEQGYSSCEGSGVEALHYHKENSIAEISLASRRAIVLAAAEIGKGM